MQGPDLAELAHVLLRFSAPAELAGTAAEHAGAAAGLAAEIEPGAAGVRRRRSPWGGWEQDLQQVLFTHLGQNAGASLDLLAENGLVPVQALSHPGIVLADTGKQERYLPGNRWLEGMGAGVVPRLQRRDGFLGLGADKHAAVGEGSPAFLQCVGDVGKSRILAFPEMVEQLVAHLVQRVVGPGGQHDQLMPSRWFGRRGFGSFLQYHMNVRPSDPQAVDAGPAWSAIACPFAKFGVDVKRACFEIDLGIGLLEVKARWNLTVFEGLGCLDD